MRYAWLIYNPAAGRFPARPFVARAANVLQSSGWSVHIVEAQAGERLETLAAGAVEAGSDAVFVAGGDGSVGRVASALAETPTALGVLPAGTANVWAQELGLPHLDWSHLFALEQAARRLAPGLVREVDLGVCNERAFLLWAGIGLDGRVVNSIEPRARWERVFPVVRYATQTLWSSLDWKGVELRVQANGQVWEDRYLVAVASNIRSYAGGLLEMAPEAKVDDGLLDFWLIGGRSMKDAIVRLAQLLLGRHVHAPGVVHFRSDRATFESDSPLPMQFDGEPSEQTPPVVFATDKRVLRVLVPEGAWPTLFTQSLGDEAQD